MGYRVECSVNIKAPREVVWRVVQDPARRKEWDVRVEHDEMLTPPPVRRGSRFRVTYKALWVRAWVEMEYIVWAPPERSGIRSVGFSKGSLVKSAGGSWHFQQHGDGSTTWTTSVNIAMRGGVLAPLLERLAIGWLFTSLTKKSQQRLKRLIEGEYTQLPSPTFA